MMSRDGRVTLESTSSRTVFSNIHGKTGMRLRDNVAVLDLRRRVGSKNALASLAVQSC